MKKILAVFAALIATCSWADYVWCGSNGGSWNDAANWTNNAVPNGSGVVADLSAASGTYAISVASDITVGKVTLASTSAVTLTLSGGKITFAAGAFLWDR